MKHIYLLIFVSVGIATFSEAQNKISSDPLQCGTNLDLEKLEKFNPESYLRVMQIQEHTEKFLEVEKNSGLINPQIVTDPSAIITIPVVVHVLHNGEGVGSGTNISLAQIQSQIDVLNEDFRRLNADKINTPSSFSGVAADAGIKFQLACIDPNGNNTDGIIRVQIPNNGTNNFNVIYNADQSPNDVATGIKSNSPAWRTDWYLNIWVVGHMTSSGNGELYGYGTLPGTVAAQFEGVVIEHNAFGRTGTLQASKNKGRVATHEIGHWLNLRHIWGDANCGDDFCNDTPQQESPTSGCVSSRTSCGTNNMIMNFMDYTDDACMNLFTNDQKSRMRANFSFGGARATFMSFNEITGNYDICTSVTYSVPNNGNTTFTWSVSGSATISSGQGTNSITVSRSGTGAATISVKANGLCITRSAWAGSPTLNNMTYGVTGTSVANIVLSVNNINANPFFYWIRSNVTGSTTWSVTPSINGYVSGSGEYILSLTTGQSADFTINSSNSCGSATTRTTRFRNVSSGLVVFPNPASDKITIQFEQNESNLPEEISLYSEKSTNPIQVFYVQELKKKNLLPEGDKLEINASGLARGTYYIHSGSGSNKANYLKLRIVLE